MGHFKIFEHKKVGHFEEKITWSSLKREMIRKWICSILGHFKIFEHMPSRAKTSFTCFLGQFKEPPVKQLTGLVLFVRNLTVLKSWTLGITSSLVFSLLRTPLKTTSGVRNRFRINKARNLNFSFFIQTKIKGTRFCFGVEYKNRVVLVRGHI